MDREIATEVPTEDVFGGLTVGEAIHPQGFSSHLRPDDTLGDLADVLAATGRTAMGITGVDHDVLGMATVNDVMRAYFEGVSAKTALSRWLDCAGARASEPYWERLQVTSDTPLSEVAEKMVVNAMRGDCACHHIMVKEADGRLHGVVSSHDLVAAFRHREMWKHLTMLIDLLQGIPPEESAAADEDDVTSMKVGDIMKPREHVFVCGPTDSLKSALRTLLVTQQNFLLVANPTGVFGFVTSRDMVKAFSDDVTLETTVEEFLRRQPSEQTHRTISSEAEVMDAAEDMTNHEVDHLVVVRPDNLEAVGVVSSLDLVLHTKAKELVFETPSWSGPTVGEALEEHVAKTAVCGDDATLEMVCGRLIAAGQTSMLVGERRDMVAHGILTETDLVRAFIAGYSKDDKIGELIDEFGQHEVPAPLQVLPTMRLTEAGAKMLDACEPGQTCHHLVVRNPAGEWMGVFSALDVARALHHLASDLDAARLGIDVLSVGSIMKPASVVPTCGPTESLGDVLSMFQECGQTAAVVTRCHSALGLITPRCALYSLESGVPPTVEVGEWIESRPMAEALRTVTPDTPVMEAAALMCQLNMHHLMVVKELGGPAAGVLSALDVVRGVVSMHHFRPFLTLGWLRRVGVPTAFVPAARAVKRAPAQDDIDGEPLAKVRRAEECGA